MRERKVTPLPDGWGRTGWGWAQGEGGHVTWTNPESHRTTSSSSSRGSRARAQSRLPNTPVKRGVPPFMAFQDEITARNPLSAWNSTLPVRVFSTNRAGSLN